MIVAEHHATASEKINIGRGYLAAKGAKVRKTKIIGEE
jgi:hypothetical protein